MADVRHTISMSPPISTYMYQLGSAAQRILGHGCHYLYFSPPNADNNPLRMVSPIINQDHSSYEIPAGPTIDLVAVTTPVATLNTNVGSVGAGIVQNHANGVDLQEMIQIPSNKAIKHKPKNLTNLMSGADLSKSPSTVKVVTPIKVDVLASYLGQSSGASYLVQGFSCGFHQGFIGHRHFRLSPNMPSCHKFSDVISQKIKAEVTSGRLKGQFLCPRSRICKLAL